MANPLRRSSLIVERKRVFKIFMALKQRSVEQDVNGNVAAMRNKCLMFTKRFGAFANTSSTEGDASCSCFLLSRLTRLRRLYMLRSPKAPGTIGLYSSQ